MAQTTGGMLGQLAIAIQELGWKHDDLLEVGIGGCAFRDEEDWALDIEQTRLCMKTSMGFIKSKRLELPDGRVIECDPSVIDALNTVRDIYIEGFKNGNDEKVMEFYAQSVAQFCVLGKERLEKWLDFVAENLHHVFGDFFLDAGRRYIMGYLAALE